MAHAAAIQQVGFELVSVASRSTEHAATLAERFGSTAVAYADLPGDADIVVVATPPQCHAADALRMLDGGGAVLLEKPLCRTLEEADQLVAAAAHHGGRLLYAENLAYAPIVQRMIALTPRIGALTHLEVRTLQGLPTWGAFTSDEWGGGALFDLGVHPLSIALLVANAAGEGSPVAVSARLRGAKGHGHPHDSDEHADVWLRYRSGLIAHVESSWQAGPESQWDAQVAGATGVVRAELLPVQSLELNGDEVALPTVTGQIPTLDQLGYTAQLRAFADDLAAQREPIMSAAFGRHVLQVVAGAYQSAGRRSDEVALPFAGPRDLTPLQLWRRG